MALKLFFKHHFLFACRYIQDSRNTILQVILYFLRIPPFLCKTFLKQVNVLKKKNLNEVKIQNIILQIKTIILQKVAV